MTKTKTIKSTITLVVLLFTTKLNYAQEIDSTRRSREVWIGGQVIVPTGDFAKKTNIILGAGINFGMVVSPVKTNDIIQVGLDLGIGYFGMTKDSILKTNSNLYTINLISRFKGPEKGRIMTYVDVLAGTKIFVLATHQNNNIIDALSNSADYTTLDSKTSSVFSYGLGIGFKIKPKKKNAKGMIDVRCLYLASGSMIYDSPSYKETWVSHTNMIIPQVSYVLVITGKKKQ